MSNLGPFESSPRPANPDTRPGLAQFGLILLVAAAIVYGSLYPFAFHDAGSFGSDIAHLARTWLRPPQSRGDLLANILLYMPLGLTIAHALAPSGSRIWALIVATAVGGALSLGIELTQFFDAGRVSTLSDFYLNVAGTLAGAALAGLTGSGWSKPSWPQGTAAAFARLLLLAWIGWRLYPYVPTIDLHKYWHSLKPLLEQPVTAYDVLRYATYWWSAIYLFHIGLGTRRTLLILPAMLCFFAAKIMILSLIITPSEVLGAGLAVILGQFLLKRQAAIGVAFLAALLLLTVISARVLPWEFAAGQKAFQWIPFYSVLHGSLQVNAISFAEKFYLYGTLLLTLVACGMRPALAIVLECAILFATSMLQTFMVGRSAEITDMVLAMLTGAVYLLLRRPSREDGSGIA